MPTLPPLHASLLILALPSFAVVSHGQKVLHEVVGDESYLGLGTSVAAAGDVDGDGLEDYWVGASNPWLWSFLDPAYAELRSGADGAVLRRITSRDSAELFAHALAAGEDLDGDGAEDVAIGAPEGQGLAAGAGTVYVHRSRPLSGTIRAREVRHPARLFRLRGLAAGDRFGAALEFLDDLDGDGVAELAVGAPGDDVGGVDSGSVRVVSGATGAKLGTLRGLPGSEFGSSLLRAWDFDGDGRRELLIGSPRGSVNVPGAGLVSMHCGRTGRVLAFYEGDTVGDLFGAAVDLAGDSNEDGTPDVVVGAPGADYARVLSGSDGSVLATASRSLSEYGTFAPPSLESGFGTAVCGVGDQNGDGRDEVAVGYPANSSVWIFSGADGSLLDLVTSSHQPSTTPNTVSVYFGFALDRLDDLDGDGLSELIVGTPADFETVSGRQTPAYDVGSAAVLSVAHEPDWVLNVEKISGMGDVDQDGYDDVVYGWFDEIELRSGKDGSVLLTWSGILSSAMAPAGDANGDTVPDLVVGGGGVRVLSGADGSELWFASGIEPGDFLGASVAGLGDLNGDGYDDVAAGAPYVVGTSFGGCDNGPGYVRAYSGLDGQVLLHVDGEGLNGLFPYDCSFGPRSEAFGLSLTGVGDWNKDGTVDLAVGAPGGGELYGGAVRVFSGADGGLLAEFEGDTFLAEFGIAIAGAPFFDPNGDGFVDLVIGEQLVGYGPSAVTTGGAQVFSGKDGSWLGGSATVGPALGYGHFIGPGYSVAVFEDFDLDGYADWATGNPVAPGPLGTGVGEIVVTSGFTRKVLERLTGTSSWDYLGYAVKNAGDTNGDGASDVLGLAEATPPTSAPSSFTRARVFPGQ